MKVWIVNPYGSLPGEAWREYRSAMLADAFARAGHEVTWWISNFEHRSKKFRCEGYSERALDSGVKVRIVPTTTYRSHVSVDRIRSERTFACNVAKIAAQTPENKPDIVVLAEPSVFYGKPIVKMAKQFGAKLVADIIDIWPEVFAMILPKAVRPLERLLLAPLYRRRASILKACDGIVGVSEDYRLVGHRAAPSMPSDVSYWGVDVAMMREAMQRENGEVHEKLGLPPKAPGEVWVIYAGTLGAGYDMASILAAAESPRLAGKPVKFLFAGDGPQRPLLEAAGAKTGTNVVYLGRLDPNDLNLLYKYCDIGLSTYLAHSTVSMPIKFYDYLAAGVATINSLDREIKRLIADHELGMQYTPGDGDSLAKAIATLASDPERLARCKANAARLGPRFDQYLQHDAFVRFAEGLK
ncbi:glycosyltransferase family 4 protein [Pandoraea sp. B-6]|uniref:glycosyltransferase family 4 protein n=1 Tax=Pandoraea sp. B-6 TaxID=1204340 RepID=UPI00034AFCAC|nr:glycosyltransferase family 4 protein [Pandoraea sp. B-6]